MSSTDIPGAPYDALPLHRMEQASDLPRSLDIRARIEQFMTPINRPYDSNGAVSEVNGHADFFDPQVFAAFLQHTLHEHGDWEQIAPHLTNEVWERHLQKLNRNFKFDIQLYGGKISLNHAAGKITGFSAEVILGILLQNLRPSEESAATVRVLTDKNAYLLPRLRKDFSITFGSDLNCVVYFGHTRLVELDALLSVENHSHRALYGLDVTTQRDMTTSKRSMAQQLQAALDPMDTTSSDAFNIILSPCEYQRAEYDRYDDIHIPSLHPIVERVAGATAWSILYGQSTYREFRNHLDGKAKENVLDFLRNAPAPAPRTETATGLPKDR